ncbi:unnamed protein product [Effrenium voratum]|nr:unnamed protein product [Effrenium voratum]
MAAHTLERQKAMGWRPLPVQQGLEMLSACLGASSTLRSRSPVLAAAPVDWPRYLRQFPKAAHLEAFGGCVAAASGRPVPADQFKAQLAAALRDLGVSGHDDSPLLGLGLDSLGAVELRNRLGRSLGLALPATMVFDYPCRRDLRAYLKTRASPGPAEPEPSITPQTPQAASMISALTLRSACTARSADVVREVPITRWDLDSYFHEEGSYSRHGSFMADVEFFDCHLFGISENEASAMDPAQRNLLEVSHASLHCSGFAGELVARRAQGLGVVVGSTQHDWFLLQDPSVRSAYGGLAVNGAILANRLSFNFALRGPSLTAGAPVDTACSSALVALRQAQAAGVREAALPVDGEAPSDWLLGLVPWLAATANPSLCPAAFLDSSSLDGRRSGPWLTACIAAVRRSSLGCRVQPAAGASGAARGETGGGTLRRQRLSRQGRCFSFASGSDGYVRGEAAVALLLAPMELTICGLDGTELRLDVEEELLGWELVRLVRLKLPPKPAQLRLIFGTSRLVAAQTLKEQGLHNQSSGHFTYAHADVVEAWCALKAGSMKEADGGLDGIMRVNFLDNFWQDLQGLTLPSSVQSLTLGAQFNQSLHTVTLPSSLQSLSLGKHFDQSLQGVSLPCSLKSLTFGAHFDQSLQEVILPNSLQSLTFGECFDHSLQGVILPSSLRSLTFGSRFNQPLQGVTLPDGLQHLAFGMFFNQRLQGIAFPAGLQSLAFGDNFSHSLQGVTLPCNLQSLTFGQSFNQGLTGLTFTTLETLRFGDRFNKSLQGVALPRLRSLSVGNLNQCLTGVTMPCLQSLTFGKYFNLTHQESGLALPSVQSIHFCASANRSLQGISLPGSLQSLILGGKFDQSLQDVTWPSTLKSLTFGDQFNQSLREVTLPCSLQSLTFGKHFNQSLYRVHLPSTLHSLTFGHWFNQCLQEVNLPKSLRCLTFGDGFDQPLQGVDLPSCLQSLTFGRSFNRSFKDVALPDTLQSLAFGDHFNQRLEHLPLHLESLSLGANFNRGLQGVTLDNLLHLSLVIFERWHLGATPRLQSFQAQNLALDLD